MAGSTVKVTLLADANQFNKTISTVTSGFNKVDQSVNKIGRTMNTFGGLLAGAAIFAGLDRMIGQLGKLEASTIAIDELFGASANSILQWAQNANQSLGLSDTAAQQAVVTFGQYAQQAKMASSESAAFAQQMTETASALAAFAGTTADEAITAIGAAFRGEYDPLERYGIAIKETTLQAYALEQGIIGVNRALTQAERIKAVKSYIDQNSVTQMAAFSRTTETTGFQLQILKSVIEDLANSFLAALAPALNIVFQGLSQLFEWIAKIPAPLVAIVALGSAFAFTAVKMTSAIAALVEMLKAMTTSMGAAASANTVATAAESAHLFKIKAVGDALAGAAQSAKLGAETTGQLAFTYTGAGIAAGQAAESTDKFTKATKAASKTERLMGFLGNWGGLIVTGIAAAAIAVGYLLSETNKALESTEQKASATRIALTELFQTDSADAFLQSVTSADGIIGQFRDDLASLGYTTDQVSALLQSNAQATDLLASSTSTLNGLLDKRAQIEATAVNDRGGSIAKAQSLAQVDAEIERYERIIALLEQRQAIEGRTGVSVQAQIALDEQNKALQEQITLWQQVVQWTQLQAQAIMRGNDLLRNRLDATEGAYSSQEKLNKSVADYNKVTNKAGAEGQRAWNLVKISADDAMNSTTLLATSSRAAGASADKAAKIAARGWDQTVASIAKAAGVGTKEANKILENITGMTKKEYKAKVAVVEEPTATIDQLKQGVEDETDQDVTQYVQIKENPAFTAQLLFNSIKTVFSTPIVQQVIVQRSGGGGGDNGDGSGGPGSTAPIQSLRIYRQGLDLINKVANGVFKTLEGGWTKIIKLAKDGNKEAQKQLDQLQAKAQRIKDLFAAWKDEVQSVANAMRDFAISVDRYEFGSSRQEKILKAQRNLNRAMEEYNAALSAANAAAQALADFQAKYDGVESLTEQIARLGSEVSSLENKIASLQDELAAGIEGTQTPAQAAKAAYQAIKNSIQSLRTAQEALRNELAGPTGEAMWKGFYEDAKTALAQVKDAAAQMASRIKDTLTGAFSLRDALNATNFAKNLRQQKDKIEKFAEDIKRLRALGLSQGVLDQIIAAGVNDGSLIIQQLSNMNIDEVNDMYASIEALAGSTGDEIANSVYGPQIAAAQAYFDQRAQDLDNYYTTEIAAQQTALALEEANWQAAMGAEIAANQAALDQKLAQLRTALESEKALRDADLAAATDAVLAYYRNLLDKTKVMPRELVKAIKDIRKDIADEGSDAGEAFGKRFVVAAQREINNISPNVEWGTFSVRAIQAYERVNGNRWRS